MRFGGDAFCCGAVLASRAAKHVGPYVRYAVLGVWVRAAKRPDSARWGGAGDTSLEAAASLFVTSASIYTQIIFEKSYWDKLS